MKLNSKIPEGKLEDKWKIYQANSSLISPANKNKLNIIVVGSGLAGAGAAATLAEMGYNIQCFCYQDSARRAHSVAAQGGINAAKIINTMEIVFGVCFTMQLKAVIFDLVRP